MTATEQDLPNCPLFDGLPLAQQKELAGLLHRESFGPGRTILAEGEQTRNLWVVGDGTCEVVKTPPGGVERSLAELGPGAVFGEMSFFHPAPHAATVRASTAVTTLRLPFDRYEELERTCPRAAYGITRAIAVVLSERLRRMDRWTAELLGKYPPQRSEEWSAFRAKLYNNWEF